MSPCVFQPRLDYQISHNGAAAPSTETDLSIRIKIQSVGEERPGNIGIRRTPTAYHVSELGSFAACGNKVSLRS